MPAHESLDKWGKVVSTIGELWSPGDVIEGGVINSFVQTGLIAVPMGAGVGGQSEPAVKVVGDAGIYASRIRFQAAGDREHTSWKEAVHIGAWIEEGVPAEELPLRSRLVLRCSENAAAQDGKRCQANNRNPDRRILRIRCHMKMPPNLMT